MTFETESFNKRIEGDGKNCGGGGADAAMLLARTSCAAVIHKRYIMGYQLWVSPVTGYRRKGTRFSALKKIFIDNVTAKNIYEPLLCCPADSRAEHAKDALKTREFDVAGVKETEGGEVIGYVITDELMGGEVNSEGRGTSLNTQITQSSR